MVHRNYISCIKIPKLINTNFVKGLFCVYNISIKFLSCALTASKLLAGKRFSAVPLYNVAQKW